jgi:hypothetical protein
VQAESFVAISDRNADIMSLGAILADQIQERAAGGTQADDLSQLVDLSAARYAGSLSASNASMTAWRAPTRST